MNYRTVILLAAAGLLWSCDAAMDQVSGEMRAGLTAQCQSVSEGFGIAGELITPVCECTADTFMQKSANELARVDRTRIEEIVRTCAADAGAPTTNTATETTGG